MISLAVARALRRAGLAWVPVRGDRFVIPDRGMDGDVFVLSDMTIEAHEHATGRVLGFNGTTEWALDSVAADDALWLPWEHQLREGLGEAFTRLERAGGAWVVTATGPAGTATTTDPDAEAAYAVSLLGQRASAARDLLPVAAHDLATVLAALAPDDWDALAPDGVRTVSQVVAGALGDVGAGAPGAWTAALSELVSVWGVGEGSGAPAAVAEAGADGVLLDLLTAAVDVAQAVGAGHHPHPACVGRALAHVRTWTSGPAAPSGPGAASDCGGGRHQDRDLAELLARTGRDAA